MREFRGPAARSERAADQTAGSVPYRWSKDADSVDPRGLQAEVIVSLQGSTRLRLSIFAGEPLVQVFDGGYELGRFWISGSTAASFELHGTPAILEISSIERCLIFKQRETGWLAVAYRAAGRADRLLDDEAVLNYRPETGTLEIGGLGERQLFEIRGDRLLRS